MTRTQSFKGLVQKHVAQDAEFGVMLLREAQDCLLPGDVYIGEAILRDMVVSG